MFKPNFIRENEQLGSPVDNYVLIFKLENVADQHLVTPQEHWLLIIKELIVLSWEWLKKDGLGAKVFGWNIRNNK